MQRRFSELLRVFERKPAKPVEVMEEPLSVAAAVVEVKAAVVEIAMEKEQNAIVERKEEEEVAPGQPATGFLNSLPVFSPVEPSSEQQTLAMVSLNLLADCNLTNSLKNEGDYRYKHAHAEAPWSVRLDKLKRLFTRHITQGQVDVFCLQEVDFYLFQSDLKPFLKQLGFASHHQWDEDVLKKKKEPNHPFGVAICFREQKFQETFRESRSRTMMIGLSHVSASVAPVVTDKKHKPMSDWFVVNCHLEADSEKNDKRMAQLSSTLFNLSVHGKINPRIAKVVVAGDFNSVPADQPFQWLLGEVQVDQIQPHAFRFRDAYANAGEEMRQASTYADPQAAERVDHVAFSADTCEVMQWLPVPSLTALTTKFGIFYGDYPSDHYPVGCLVRALPVAQDGGEEAREAEEESGELTPGQLRVLEFLERGAPKRAGKGKPSPQEVLAMKAHTASMQAFSSHLNKAQKAWVAKWRKSYKPAEEENISKRVGRSMSMTLQVQQQQQQEMFVGVGELFQEGEEPMAELPPLPPKPSAPGLTKRRQTLFASKSVMF
ncbi:hypothetical protein BASA81_012490 [Batrachochytrium salamandrivorans]|nr:hypothetical protein BASA81_012490 [Batrachochytrium salamandrivorans]